MSRGLPSGRVTFAFVDVVSSTKTFAEHGEAFVAALAVLQEQVARHTQAAGGVVVKTEGDGAFLAFRSAGSAVEALVGLQAELAEVPEPTVPRLRVRAGAHSGDAVPVADDYVALAVNVAARVTSTVNAGQVVISAATAAELPEPVGVCVGDYDLKDVADPVELWRVHGDDTPLRGSPSRRTNVRIPVTGFVGRVEELADLRDLVGEQRLVTVLGPGGMGKTRLVSELVLQIATGIGGGAWLVELASLSTGDQVAGAVGQVLGLNTGDVGAIGAEVRRRGEVLLVLDNCEHLLDAVADLVSDLQEAAPDVRLLCTSREALQVPGEQVWRLGPFEGQAARLELFTQRAWASGTSVQDDSAPLVDRLCNALDGLPLGIELAATQSGSTSLEDLLRIAEHGTDGLGRRGGDARQRSLDAVLAWSLNCLPAPRRNSLLVLSIVPGRFDLEMAATILAAVDGCEDDAVRPLTRASLIDLDGESYRILDTIRHAAHRQLGSDPDLAQAARLGLRIWAQSVAASVYPVRELDDAIVGRLLALETALEQAMDDGATEVGKLWNLVSMISHYREPSGRAVGLAQRVISESALPTNPDEVQRFASAIQLLENLRLMPDIDDHLEAVSSAADLLGVSREVADLHQRLQWYYVERGNATAARRHVNAYRMFLSGPAADLIDTAVAFHMRAYVCRADGDFEGALENGEQSVRVMKDAGIELDLGIGEFAIGEFLLDLRRPVEALPHLAEAFRRIPTPGPLRRQLLMQLARAQHQLGDTDATTAIVREVEAELFASGLPRERVRAELEGLLQEVPSVAEAMAPQGRSVGP